MGNRALLRKLILLFGRNYAGAVADLRHMVADGDLIEAERRAHTLKGAAATLEVVTVAAAAEAVEYACRERAAARVPALLDALQAHLVPALVASARLAACAETTAAPRVAAATAGCDPVAARAILADLTDLIARNSLKARKRFADLAAALAQDGAIGHLEPIAACLAALDFEPAARLVAALADSLPDHADD